MDLSPETQGRVDGPVVLPPVKLNADSITKDRLGVKEQEGTTKKRSGGMGAGRKQRRTKFPPSRLRILKKGSEGSGNNKW